MFGKETEQPFPLRLVEARAFYAPAIEFQRLPHDTSSIGQIDLEHNFARTFMPRLIQKRTNVD
jgi:hypothetical protein